MLRDFDDWDSKSGVSSPLSPSHAESAVGEKLYDNPEFRRTGSEVEDGGKYQGAAASPKHALAVASAEVDKVNEPGMSSPMRPKVAPTEIPTSVMGAEVYHMGQYAYKGVSEKVQLCQVFPAILSGRRHAYSDTAFHGKAACSKRDDSLMLSVRVNLPDVLHLPLSSEPPLCLNMVVPSSKLERQ